MQGMQYRPAQKGKALGASGFIIDWSFAHSNPADSAALQLAQDGQQERGNHPVLFATLPRSRRQPMYESGWLGWSRKRMPWVTPGICPLGPRWME